MSHKGFDTSFGSRVEARLADLLSRLTEELAVPPIVATATATAAVAPAAVATAAVAPVVAPVVAPAVVAPTVAKARKVAEQRVLVKGVPVSVPAAARPGSPRLGFAITPARPLRARHFAGGRNWHDTQKTEE